VIRGFVGVLHLLFLPVAFYLFDVKYPLPFPPVVMYLRLNISRCVYVFE